MSNALTEWQIVGGMRWPEDIVGFARAPLVLRRGADLMIVRQLGASEVPAGEALTSDEWDGLCASEEGFVLKTPVVAFAHAALWLLGRDFAGGPRDKARRDLEGRGAVVAMEEHGATLAVIVNETNTGGLRETWAGEAFNRAWQALRDRDSAAAGRAAGLAFELPARFVDRYLAMLVLAMELGGDKERAEGYLVMARNSRGDGFYQEVCAMKERLATDVQLAAGPGRAGRASDRGRWQRAAISESFEAMMGSHL